MEIFNFKSEYHFGANTYVTFSDGEYALIDPATSPEKLLSAIEASPGDFRYIILTHAHFDHILFIEEWQKLTGLPITVSYNDASMLRDSYFNCYELFLGIKQAFYGEISTVKGGDSLPFGNTALKIHDVPGHTPGSILIEEGNNLFVGDTVFANNGYGRCDLPGGNFEKLKESIKKIHEFDSDTNVYPGHGEKTKVSKIIRI